MAQETIVLVSNLSDKFVTAQDDINNNFNELYAGSPPTLTGNALKYLRVNAGETATEWVSSSASVAWGAITGTLSSQTDLQSALDAKVPYTGATADVDLDPFSLNAKSLHVKGTAGAGHLGLKHQSANITASASESSIGANVSGDPVWKNDGNPLQNIMLENAAITGATKTKITYDSKGLVTSGSDAAFTDLSDVPANYTGAGLKLVRVNATPNALEFVTADKTLVGLSNVANVDTTTTANITDSTNKRFITDAQQTVLGNTSGTNTGDQTSIVGITGTKAQFDTAVTDGNILYVGDVTQYTDEMAQDAVGAMVDTTLVYTDATPLLSRAALTGAITASAGSNTTSLGSFTTSQLNTALSDNDVATLAGAESLTNKKLGSLTTNGFVKTSGSDGTLSVDTGAYLLNTTTSNVGTSPTANGTTTVTHGLGRIPQIIRIYGYGTFTSNAAATPTTSSIGLYCSSGNRCVYQGYSTTSITTSQAAATSTTFAIRLDTGVNNFITGVIQNVGATTFDIVWTETGTATAQVYMWEAQ